MAVYQPNFNDARVLKRIRHAYGFARAVMSETKPHAWSSRYMDKYLGQQQNPLGKYLRDVMLICTNHRYVMGEGKNKEYILNRQGMNFIRAILLGEDSMSYPLDKNSVKDEEDNPTPNLSPSVLLLYDLQVVNNWCQREYGEELKSLTFFYEDKSNRLWHPLQNVRKENKQLVLAESGLVHQYDIECCAPTLIYQHALKNGLEEYPVHIRHYIDNKAQVRQQLTQLTGLEPNIVKVVINALFCGARLGLSPHFALSQLLQNKPDVITALQQSQVVTDLRNDIRMCWHAIEPSMTRIEITTVTGKTRKKPLSSKHKWIRYFQLERQVLDSVRNYLRETNNRCFLEHDGWTTENQINLHELTKWVKDKTGYQISMSYQMINDEKSSR